MINPSCLIIAGSDSGAGAGLQADLKTFSAHNIYASTVITAITAQNTIGVDEVMNVPSDMIESQIKAIAKDLKISIIKIGMLSNSEIIDVISYSLKKYLSEIPIILDPVMVAKGGHSLLNNDSIESLKKKLFPKSLLITPNLPEAEKILKTKIKNNKDMENNIEMFRDIEVENVLVKGGHLNGNKVIDLLLNNGKVYKFISDKIKTTNTHGTGCTLASAIACNIFKGFNLNDSIKNARNYVINCIKNPFIIGNGHNPLNHFYNLFN
jgi:hydroxymethylpyrimidine/phosphomethylpyrimidine kinase